MVFNQNLVAVIKNKGQILRETRSDNDTVYIPFGSEYSILLKNLNTVKALVNVEVDGREAISELIVHPNSDVELERFFEDDMNKGHKFKFVEKTENIRNYRGDKIEDGIIRITYRFENKTYINKIDPCPWKTLHPWTPWRIDDYYERWSFPGGTRHYKYYVNDIGYEVFDSSNDGNTRSATFTNTNSDISCYGLDNTKMWSQEINNNNRLNQINDDGITVEGNYSNQSFVRGNIGMLEPHTYCINIQLKGYFPNKGEVKTPLTTKIKIQCEYCGKRNFGKNKFCSECGSCLV